MTNKKQWKSRQIEKVYLLFFLSRQKVYWMLVADY
jgi:hypothetical protein